MADLRDKALGLSGNLRSLMGVVDPIKAFLGYPVNDVPTVIDAGDRSKFFVRFVDGGFTRALHKGRVAAEYGLPVDLIIDKLGNYEIVGIRTGEDAAVSKEHGTGVYVGPHTHPLSDITDVSVLSPTDGELLTWVVADSKWENKPAVGFANPMTTGGDLIYEAPATTGHTENTDRSGIVNLGAILAETIIGDCNLTQVPNGNVVVTYNVWESAYWPGHDVAVVFRLRRTDLLGTALVTSGTLHANIDSNAGHDVNWSGIFTDTSPTDGHYVLTAQETIGSVAIYSDTREFDLDTSPTVATIDRLPIGSNGDFLRVSSALVPEWQSISVTAGNIVDLILTDDDGEVLTDDDGVVLLGDP